MKKLLNLHRAKKLTRNDQKFISGGDRPGCYAPAFEGSTTMVPVSIAGCGSQLPAKCFIMDNIHVGCGEGTHCISGECKRYVDDL